MINITSDELSRNADDPMLSELSDRLPACFPPYESSPPNLDLSHHLEHQLTGIPQKIRIFENIWPNQEHFCFLSKRPRRGSVPQVTMASSPAKMPTRLCSEQLKIPQLNTMGPVEYLNSTKEKIPLTPIGDHRADSPTKFLPISMSSDNGPFDSGMRIMSPELLYDVKVSRLQSMPLESIQKRLVQAPERLEAQEMNQGDEDEQKLPLVDEKAHTERSQ